MNYLSDCWKRAKECIVLIPFIILPLLCYGVAKGSEAVEEPQNENYFLPDTTKAVETPPQEIIEEKEIIKEEGKSNFVIIKRGTVYNPEPEQCWGDPWKSATGKIDSVKLATGQLRWCALSPDLLERIPMHSKIKVHHSDKKIEGIWYVRDVCGTESTIDFLKPSSVRTGLWHNIKIEILREGK